MALKKLNGVIPEFCRFSGDTPHVLVVMIDEAMIQEYRKVLRSVEKDVPILHFMDTTYNMGDNLLTTITYQHPLLVREDSGHNANVPLISYLHQRRSGLDHDMSIAGAVGVIKKNIPEFLTANKIIVSDREFPHIEQFFGGSQVYCWNHLKKNLTDHLENKLHLREDYVTTLQQDFETLLRSRSLETYTERRDEYFNGKEAWQIEGVQGYYMRNLDEAIRTKAGRWYLEEIGVPIPERGQTNNPSETYNSQIAYLKTKVSENKTAPEYVVDLYIHIGDWVNDLKRGYYNVGLLRVHNDYQHLIKDKILLPAAQQRSREELIERARQYGVLDESFESVLETPIEDKNVAQLAKDVNDKGLCVQVELPGLGKVWCTTDPRTATAHITDIGRKTCTCEAKTTCHHMLAALVASGFQHDYTIPTRRKESMVRRSRSATRPGKRSIYSQKKPTREAMSHKMIHPLKKRTQSVPSITKHQGPLVMLRDEDGNPIDIDPGDLTNENDSSFNVTIESLLMQSTRVLRPPKDQRNEVNELLTDVEDQPMSRNQGLSSSTPNSTLVAGDAHFSYLVDDAVFPHSTPEEEEDVIQTSTNNVADTTSSKRTRIFDERELAPDVQEMLNKANIHPDIIYPDLTIRPEEVQINKTTNGRLTILTENNKVVVLQHVPGKGVVIFGESHADFTDITMDVAAKASSTTRVGKMTKNGKPYYYASVATKVCKKGQMLRQAESLSKRKVLPKGELKFSQKKLHCVCTSHIMSKGESITCSSCDREYHKSCIETPTQEDWKCGPCSLPFHGIPWMANSCTIDNHFTLLQLKEEECPGFRKTISNTAAGYILSQAIKDCTEGQYKSAKMRWWDNLMNKDEGAEFNLYGEVSEILHQPLSNVLNFEFTVMCSNPDCTNNEDHRPNCFIIDSDIPVTEYINDVVNGKTSICGPCRSDTDSYELITTALTFEDKNNPPPFIDFENQCDYRRPEEMFEAPKEIKIDGVDYEKRMIVLYKPEHYTSLIWYKGEMLHYDGMLQPKFRPAMPSDYLGDEKIMMQYLTYVRKK